MLSAAIPISHRSVQWKIQFLEFSPDGQYLAASLFPVKKGFEPLIALISLQHPEPQLLTSELLSLKSFADLEFDTESRYLALLGTDGLMMIYDIENKVPSPLVNLATSMSEPLSSELPGSIAPSIHPDTVAGKDVGSPYLFSALGSNKTGGFVVASFRKSESNLQNIEILQVTPPEPARGTPDGVSNVMSAQWVVRRGRKPD